MNHFLGRTSETTIKLRTLSDCMCRVGNEVTQKLSNITAQTLRMYGFDKESGLPREDVTLAETVTSVSESSNIEIDEQKIITAMDAVNQSREEKIQIPVEEVKIESTPSECIYISIDDIGVKHQKDFRKEGSVREYKFVENTVAYIQYADKSCVLTGIGMQNVFKSVLAFLLANNLLSHELVFLTDGAKDINGYIDSIFQFHPYSVILDWYHLKKRCQERLSQSIRGKDKRNVVLEKLLRYLWVGDVSGATTFLTHLKPEEIKSQKWLDDLLGYLARKSYAIPCYAVRAKLGLNNSSHAVEKANDILIAQRQKHNGMAWSPNGSSALASLQMIYLNNQQELWFRKKELLFCDFFKNVKKAA